MACRGEHELAGQQLQLAEQRRGDAVEAEQTPARLEGRSELKRTTDLPDEDPGGTSELAHQCGRLPVVSGDVADEEAHPTVRQRD